MDKKEATIVRAGNKTILTICALLFFVAGLTVSRVDAQYPESTNDSPMSSDASYPGTDGNAQIPPGMKVVKSGDVRVVIPEGSQLRKINDLFLIESAEEYAARKFQDADRRFEGIEKQLAEIKEEVKNLRNEMPQKGE